MNIFSLVTVWKTSIISSHGQTKTEKTWLLLHELAEKSDKYKNLKKVLYIFSTNIV